MVRRMQVIDMERHVKREQEREDNSFERERPKEPWTVQRVNNANAAHRGFLKWLGLAELSMNGGDTVERDIRLGGFPIDRMSTEHSRQFHLLIWELCVWNLNYFEAKARLYVELCDAEKKRAQFVRSELDAFKNG